MSFELDSRSLTVLQDVDDRLARVVVRASGLSFMKFWVVSGLRSYDQQARLFGQGRRPSQLKAMGLDPELARPTMTAVVWTMKTKHLGDETGKARAVDLGLITENKRPVVIWQNDSLYHQLAASMKEAARLENVGISWGGDWHAHRSPRHYEIREIIRA